MSLLESFESVADLELIEFARDGRSDALAELWSRHYDGAVRTARRWTNNAYDAEDVASEAFSRMLAAVGEGGGPTGSVGGYLAISVRNLVVNRAKRAESGNLRVADPEIYALPQSTHANPVAERVELGLVREAFSKLPIRWRIVLWRTAVDRDTNQTLAQDMGMTANAVAALGVRARAGFRLAYLQAHVSRGTIKPACQPFIVLLPPLVSGGKPSPSLTAHLEDCTRCQDRAAELLEIERHLAALIFPAVLVAGWSQLGTLRPRPGLGRTANAAGRPRAWMLAGAGSVAATAIVVAGVVEPDSGPPRAAAADRQSPVPVVTATTPQPLDVPPAAAVEPAPAPEAAPPTRVAVAPVAIRTTAPPAPPVPAPVVVTPSPTTTPSAIPAPTPTLSEQCHWNEHARPKWCTDKPYVPEASPSPSPDPSPSPSPESSPSPSPEASPSPEPSPSPSPESSPSPSPSPEPSPSPSPEQPS